MSTLIALGRDRGGTFSSRNLCLFRTEGTAVLEIAAVALNPLDVSIGAGRFYGGSPPLPYVPGSEAVGRVLGLKGRMT